MLAPRGVLAITSWLFTVGLTALILVIAIGTVRSGQLLQRWTPPYNLLLSIPDNLMRLAVVGLSLLLGYTFGPGPGPLGWSTSHLGEEIVLGAVSGLLMALLLNVIGQLVMRRWGPDVFSVKLLRCMLPTNGPEWAGTLLALLPAAALEELLFRSLPLGGLGSWFAPWWLMWPLSLFFGLLHWPQGGWGVAGTTLAAIMLSLLFLASGSIWLPLAAHYAMNVVQLAAARYTGVTPLRQP